MECSPFERVKNVDQVLALQNGTFRTSKICFMSRLFLQIICNENVTGLSFLIAKQTLLTFAEDDIVAVLPSALPSNQPNLRCQYFQDQPSVESNREYKRTLPYAKNMQASTVLPMSKCDELILPAFAAECCQSKRLLQRCSIFQINPFTKRTQQTNFNLEIRCVIPEPRALSRSDSCNLSENSSHIPDGMQIYNVLRCLKMLIQDLKRLKARLLLCLTF